jgi:glutaminyl-peptide cyclotransferase
MLRANRFPLFLVVVVAATVILVSAYFYNRSNRSAKAPPPEPVLYGYEVVHEYPHDPEASTQGLIYRNGFLYESTGGTGRSSLRKVRLETGEVVQKAHVDDLFFAEGLTDWGDKLLQLAPIRTGTTEVRDASSLVASVRRHLGLNTGLTYDVNSFEPGATFSYEGDGWGLTHDDRRLILSDGTSRIRFLHPRRFESAGEMSVTDRGRPVRSLNELEFVKGEIYANIFHQDRIVRIHPESGDVTGWIDLSELRMRVAASLPDSEDAMLNGIAYDAAGDRLFVTGKLWPILFEIRLHPTH